MDELGVALISVAVILIANASLWAGGLVINFKPADALRVTSFENEESLSLIGVSGGRVSRVKIHATDGEYALRVELDANVNGWPNIHFVLGSEKAPADWSKYQGIMFDVRATAGKKVSYAVRIDAEADGAESKAVNLLFPATTDQQTFMLRFDEPDDMESRVLGMLMGIEGVELPSMQKSDLRHRKSVKVFQIYASRPDEDCVLYIDNVQLIGRLESDVPTENIVDRFGQNALLDWPGKIHSVEQLKQYDREEAEWLETVPPTDENRDMYGGLIHPDYKFEATGYFRLEKVGETWWMIDPIGNLYFHNTLCNIEPSAAPTGTKGRKSLFEWLPDKGDESDPLSVAYEYYVFSEIEGVMNFDIANLIRKYGDDWMAKWRARAKRRLEVWGYNAVHNWVKADVWCDEDGNHIVPYSVTWYPQGNTPMLTEGIRGGMPDVFSDEFPGEVDRHIKKVTAGLADDSMLVGHFIGGELDWRGLCNAFPRMSIETACAKRLREYLREKYNNDVEALRKSWNNEAVTFEDLMPDESAGEEMRQDMLGFLEIFADRYFKISTEAIRRYNPNHLILGERAHPSNFQDEVVRATGRHCDAISYDIYGDEPGPQCDRVYELTGRPMLIAEMGFRGRDRGLAGSHNTLPTQAARGQAYEFYMKKLLNKPYFVGMLMFCYRDQMFTAAPFGEAFNYGLVSITDTPYPEYVESVIRVNRDLYNTRLNMSE